MESIVSEIVDTERLSEFVKSSLGNLDKLRNVSNALRDHPKICSILEDELIGCLDKLPDGDRLQGDSYSQEYLHWLCCILDHLTVEKWSTRTEILWAAVCDAELVCGPALLKLAVRSNVIAENALLNHINELPPAALIHGMRAVHNKDILLDVAVKLLDDMTFIHLLVDAMNLKPTQVNSILSRDDIVNRLDVALKALHKGDDGCLKRSSLALIGQLLSKREVAGGDLIVNMLSVAEQKQVHLIEPVLVQFVEATRNSSISDVFWTLCVFQRLFYHQTSWVRTASLHQFLNLRDFHRQVFIDKAESFYAESFLDAIDQLSLYARTETCSLASPSPIGSGVRGWLQGIQEYVCKKQFRPFISNLLHKVCARNSWNSVALLYISEAIVCLEGVPVLDNLQPIQTSLSIWSFQEPLVRRYIVRLWLKIACKFSTEDTRARQLSQLASHFLEDADSIRGNLISLDVDIPTPVGLCVLGWTKKDDCAQKALNQNAGDARLWLLLSKIRSIPSVWHILKKAIEVSNAQIAGLALLKSSEVHEGEKNAIVEVLGETELSRDLFENVIDQNSDWRLLYLWSKVATEDSSICTRCFVEVAQISDWAEMFAKPSVTHMIRTLTNLSILQGSQGYATETLELVCSLLPLTPRPMIPDIFRLIKAYLKAAKDRETLARILKMSWMSCLETRKATTMFAECVSVFMSVLFNRTVYMRAFSDMLEVCAMIREYVDSMPWFGEMFYLTMLEFLTENPRCTGDMCDQLALGLCYGPIFRKDQKVILDTERYLLNKLASVDGPDLPDLRALTECDAAINVRARCISFATTLESTDAWKLIEALQTHDRAVSSTRKRYFNNSTIHREKTRAWQAILVLLDTAASLSTSEMWCFLQDILEQLKNDSHQMTVRILMEWCAVKAIIRWQLDVVGSVTTAIDKASVERIGSICSYLNILMHVCCAAPDCQLVERSARLVMPWMMAQHFAVRLHAQFVFRRIVGLCRCQSQACCRNRYEPQLDALQRLVNYGGGAKNAAKLDGDFYMAECVLPECETYDLVFDKIPKAYGLIDVDCIPRELFVDDSRWAKDSGRQVNTELKIEMVDENCSRPDATTTIQEANYQRKIVPVSALLEEDGRLSSPSWNAVGSASRNDCKQEQLIVIASLIDRLPNLGGICRTAEIFGVSELAIANVKILDMKEFHNLSVSSHHWLPIRGVPPLAIEEYLREKKAEGFTLVGVEQTARSVPLNHFVFPKKSLLLLGNEKEGLPLHLIHEVDHCVEIPQQGVVRSLNVHVSAALLIWEYRKQHMASSTASCRATDNEGCSTVDTAHGQTE